ncbi:hypothetical protein DPMN_130771 [Dreissena polymorpha]|uniref:Uncharacterized protein n=1 Tax=Dreissena polymorpha TaxID=45954 RepID=A0A9D4H569_DREPO|nr:hypothetical protein DPMN_130771 [Dreissena polymorpha]
MQYPGSDWTGTRIQQGTTTLRGDRDCYQPPRSDLTGTSIAGSNPCLHNQPRDASLATWYNCTIVIFPIFIIN